MGNETYNTKKVKKEHKEENKADLGTEDKQEAPIPPVTHANNYFHCVFPIVEVYVSNQQNYNFIGFYAHKSYNSNNLKGAISEYKGFLHCEGYNYEEFLDENMDALLSEPNFTRKLKMLSRPDGFMLYGKLGVDFFLNSDFLCTNMKVRLQLFKTRPKFYLISDNATLVLEMFDRSVYTRCIALKGDYAPLHRIAIAMSTNFAFTGS